MTYLQDKNRKQKILAQRTALVVFCIILVFGITKVQKVFSPAISSGFSSIGKTGTSVTNAGLWSYFVSKSKLTNENTRLKLQITELQIKNTELGLVEEENKEFRNILQTVPDNIKKILVKSVGDSTLYGTIVIDSGSNKNIKIGDLLLGSHGGILGTVNEVHETAGQVLLMDSSVIPTRLLALDSNTFLEAHGDSRGVLSADVPRDTQIETGEVVVLASNPKIIVGRVAVSKGDERNPFKQILIRMEDQYRYSPYLYIIEK